MVLKIIFIAITEKKLSMLTLKHKTKYILSLTYTVIMDGITENKSLLSRHKNDCPAQS